MSESEKNTTRMKMKKLSASKINGKLSRKINGKLSQSLIASDSGGPLPPNGSAGCFFSLFFLFAAIASEVTL